MYIYKFKTVALASYLLMPSEQLSSGYCLSINAIILRNTSD